MLARLILSLQPEILALLMGLGYLPLFLLNDPTARMIAFALCLYILAWAGSIPTHIRGIALSGEERLAWSRGFVKY